MIESPTGWLWTIAIGLAIFILTLGILVVAYHGKQNTSKENPLEVEK